MKTQVDIDYNIEDQYLFINDFCVKKQFREKGVGTKYINTLINENKEKGIKNVIVPATISKNSLAFWYKLNFRPYYKEDEKDIKKIMQGKQCPEKVFDINCNSVVVLYKAL